MEHTTIETKTFELERARQAVKNAEQALRELNREHEDLCAKRKEARKAHEGAFERAKMLEAELKTLKAEKARGKEERRPRQCSLSRAAVIETAKKDVEDLRRQMVNGTRKTEGSYAFREKMTDVEFKYEGRRTTAIVRCVFTGQVLDMATIIAPDSICANKHLGNAIALRKALRLEVPTYYIDAPQPIHVRAGDKVRSLMGGKPMTAGKRYPEKDHLFGCAFETRENSMVWFGEDQVKIIDDTRE